MLHILRAAIRLIVAVGHDNRGALLPSRMPLDTADVVQQKAPASWYKMSDITNKTGQLLATADRRPRNGKALATAHTLRKHDETRTSLRKNRFTATPRHTRAPTARTLRHCVVEKGSIRTCMEPLKKGTTLTGGQLKARLASKI